MYCSECGNELVDELAFTEEGQEDHPWCRVCVDYCDALEENPNGRKSQGWY